MDKKYELTDEKIEFFGTTLYRIRALRDIPAIEVKAGDLGGFIEKEENLSHDGNAWVYGDAWVYGNAEVSGNARVYGNAEVSGNARVYGDARVHGNAWVSGDARVYGNAWVSGDARVYGNAEVSGNARVSGDAWVSGDARVYGNAEVSGNAWVYGDARVHGDAWVMWASKIGSRLGTTTVFKCVDDTVKVTCGCFFGTLDEFAQKVEDTHGDNRYGREYKAFIELVKIHFEKEN